VRLKAKTRQMLDKLEKGERKKVIRRPVPKGRGRERIGWHGENLRHGLLGES